MRNIEFPSWPSFTKEDCKAVEKVLLSNKVNYWTGVECQKFEEEFANWVGSNFAISLCNGTVALELALRALKLSKDAEVIVTSRSFVASASSIVNAGAVPVFADVEVDSQNISINTIQECVTDKTEAIICVHLAGWPCEMDEIIKFAKDRSIYVVEDCSQAHGATYKDKSVGSIGDIGCWSFCQDKIMTTGGEGGMVTTNKQVFWERMWSYKDHGKNFYSISQGKKNNFMWVHDSIGSNFRMTEIQATLGRIQLKKMNDWTTKRFANAMRIWEYARKIQGLIVPNVPNHIGHAAYKCYIFLDLEKISYDRQKIVEEINANGVPCYSGSCPEIYLEKAFSNIRKSEKRHKNAILLGNSSLMFLVHPTLEDRHIQRTCDVLKTVMSKVSN